jgi:putative DNA primase/helicase
MSGRPVLPPTRRTSLAAGRRMPVEGATISAASLREIARALGGEVAGRQVSCAGPGHSPRDRSLSVKISRDGNILVHSFAGDDWRLCADYVHERLGLPAFGARGAFDKSERRPRPVKREPRQSSPDYALAIWRDAVDLRGTLGELYLRRDRGLDCSEDVPHCLRWDKKNRALIALFRDIATDEPRPISRIFLDAEGRKIERKFLGPVAGCAVKIDSDENVTMGVIIAEGIETCLAARQLGFAPVWALGSVGAIAKFPVLNGIEALTILAEEGEPSRKAVQECFERWRAAGRKVIIRKSIIGSDINDALRGTS